MSTDSRPLEITDEKIGSDDSDRAQKPTRLSKEQCDSLRLFMELFNAIDTMYAAATPEQLPYIGALSHAMNELVGASGDVGALIVALENAQKAHDHLMAVVNTNTR